MVVLGKDGKVAMVFNTDAMARAYKGPDGEIVALYPEPGSPRAARVHGVRGESDFSDSEDVIHYSPAQSSRPSQSTPALALEAVLEEIASR